MESKTTFQPVGITKKSLIENSGRSVMLCDENVNVSLEIPKSSFIFGILGYDGVNGVYNIRREDEVWSLPISGLKLLLVRDQGI